MALGSSSLVRMDLSFKNVAAVVSNFYKVDPILQRAARRLVREAGQYMHDLTYFLAPVDTGFMREHIRVLYGIEGLSFEVGWYEEDFIMAGLSFYPIYQEFGTMKMAAQPSLAPAYEDTKDWFIPALTRELSAAIERIRDDGRER